MKQVIEAYVGLWIVMFLLMIAIAFTTINLHVSQARRIANSIKSEVQASNGSIVDSEGSDGILEGTSDKVINKDGYQFSYIIKRQTVVDDSVTSEDETYIYNDIYKISLVYEYLVPLFGKQIYPIEMFAY